MTTTLTLRTLATAATERGHLLIVDPAPVLALLARLDHIAAALRPALEAAEAATPGPWVAAPDAWGMMMIDAPDDVVAEMVAEIGNGSANAALIVSAVNALPALRAALEGD